ncbi:MAG: FAD-binding oxidoreductase [Bacillota bacterium]
MDGDILATGRAERLPGVGWVTGGAVLAGYGPAAVAAACPERAGSIPGVLELAARWALPVVVRAGGTRPSFRLRRHLVLDLSRLPKDITIDRDNHSARASAGVTVAALQQAAARQRLSYPPDPLSASTCTVGGTVATNAAGPGSVRYGSTADYLLGLELVTATGDVLHAGGQTLKNATGYDLSRLLAGSRGTLGVVTSVSVRLLPRVRARKSLLVEGRDLAGLAGHAATWSSLPTLARLELVNDRARDQAGLEGAGTWLWAEFEGQPEELARDTASIPGGRDVTRHRRQFWRSRLRLAAGLHDPSAWPVWVVLHPKRQEAGLRRLEALGGNAAVLFGHGALGAWHAVWPWAIERDRLWDGLGETALSVEVGAEDHRWLQRAMGTAWPWFCRIKHEVDPAGLLDPEALGLDTASQHDSSFGHSKPPGRE